jgi:hypothetical protein
MFAAKEILLTHLILHNILHNISRACENAVLFGFAQGGFKAGAGAITIFITISNSRRAGKCGDGARALSRGRRLHRG